MKNSQQISTQVEPRVPFFASSLDVDETIRCFKAYCDIRYWLTEYPRFISRFHIKLQELIGPDDYIRDIKYFTHLALCLPTGFSVTKRNDYSESVIQQLIDHLYACEKDNFADLPLEYDRKDYIHFLLHQPGGIVKAVFAEKSSEQLIGFCRRLVHDWTINPDANFLIGDSLGGLLSDLHRHDQDHLFALFRRIFMPKKRSPELIRRVLTDLILAIPAKECQGAIDVFRMRNNTMPENFLSEILRRYTPAEIAVIMQDYAVLADRQAFEHISNEVSFSPVRWLFRDITWEKERSILTELYVQGLVPCFRTLYFWAGKRKRRRDFLCHLLRANTKEPSRIRGTCIAEAMQTEWLLCNETLFSNADIIFAVAEYAGPQTMESAFLRTWHFFWDLEKNATYLSEFTLRYFIIRKVNRRSKRLSQILKKQADLRHRLKDSSSEYIEVECRKAARRELTAWYTEWLFAHPDAPTQVLEVAKKRSKKQ